MADSIDKSTLVNYARQMAQQYGIDPNIFIAQLNQESGFDPTARNPVSGATGVGQLMPQYYQGVNLTDPYSNIKAAAATDAGYLQRYNGDYNLMLAAYNAGPGNVDKYRGVPPFQETQSYIKNIMGSSSADNTAKIMGTMQSGDTTQQVIDQATGSNSTADSAQSSTGGISQDDFDNLVKQHGGVAGVSKPLDPTTNDPMLGPVPNQNPQRRYTFKDGTYVVLTAATDANGTKTGYNIVGGNALSGSKSGSYGQYSAPNNSPYIVVRNPDGSPSYVPNPNYNPNQQVNTNANDPYIVTRDASGNLQREPNPNYNPSATRSQGQVHQFPDGSLWQQDPQSGAWSQVAAADPLQRQQLQLEIAKAQKQLEPQQQAAFENATQTIDYLKQLYTDGKISLADMNNNMDLVRQNLDASLKGTTLFQQEQEKARQREVQAQLGQQILAQRLQTGTGMARDILNTAANSHIMLPKGQSTLGLNPLSMAMSAVNAFGGGQQMGDLASKLIQGIMGGQVPANTGAAALNSLLSSYKGSAGGAGGGSAPIGPGTVSSSPSNGGGFSGVVPSGTIPGGMNESGYPPGFEQNNPQSSSAPSAQPSGGVLGPDTPYQPTSVGQLGSGALSPDTTPNQGVSINTDNPGVSLPSTGGLASQLLSALIGGASQPALQQGLATLGIR